MANKDTIVVYARVSSAAQSLSLQIDMAKQFMKRENIDLDQSIFIENHDVSATKLKTFEREGLTKVIDLIKTNQLKKLIVYKRDRLARNFYEYTDLVKLFVEYEVDVIFTATDEAAFSKNLSFESIHGIFAQMEGGHIKIRTDDARKQYPSNIFGYTRTKLKNSVRFTPHPEQAKLIRTLFDKASTITSADTFIQFLIEKDIFKFDRKLKILTNLFYAGYFKKEDIFQKLSHVEGLISLSTFKKVNHIINFYLTDFQNVISNTPSLHYALPFCAICKRKMKLKQLSPVTAGFLYCSNKHKKIEISIIEYNQQISITMHEEISKLDPSHLKKIVLIKLRKEKMKLVQQLKKMKNNYQMDTLSLTSLFDSVEARYDKSLAHLENCKNSILKIEDDIATIDDLIKEIKSLINHLISFEMKMNQKELSQIASLLIENVFIDKDNTSISLYLTTERNEGLTC